MVLSIISAIDSKETHKTPKRDFTLFGVYRYNPYQIFNMLADGFSLIKEYLCEY